MFSISVDTIQRYYCSTVWPPPAAIAAAILLGMDSLSELRYSGVIALQTLRATFLIPLFDVSCSFLCKCFIWDQKILMEFKSGLFSGHPANLILQA